MGRSVLGIIIGYITMVIVVMVTFSVVYLIMGTEASYKPGSYDVSTLWIIVSFILSIVAAVVGGFVCSIISKNAKAPLILAVVVLVLGFAMAIPELTHDDSTTPTVRTGDISLTDAMSKSKQPDWITIITPLIGAAGVVWGGRLKKQE